MAAMRSWWSELHLNRPVQALTDASQQNVECDGVWAEPACLHILQHALRRLQISHPHKPVYQCSVHNLQYMANVIKPL